MANLIAHTVSLSIPEHPGGHFDHPLSQFLSLSASASAFRFRRLSPRCLRAHPRCAAGSHSFPSPPRPRAQHHRTSTHALLCYCYSSTSSVFSDPALIENIPVRNGRERQRENLYTKFTAPACAFLSPPEPLPEAARRGTGERRDGQRGVSAPA